MPNTVAVLAIVAVLTVGALAVSLARARRVLRAARSDSAMREARMRAVIAARGDQGALTDDDHFELLLEDVEAEAGIAAADELRAQRDQMLKSLADAGHSTVTDGEPGRTPDRPR